MTTATELVFFVALSLYIYGEVNKIIDREKARKNNERMRQELVRMQEASQAGKPAESKLSKAKASFVAEKIPKAKKLIKKTVKPVKK